MFLVRSLASLPPQGMSREPKFPLAGPTSHDSTLAPTCRGWALGRADHLSGFCAAVARLCTRTYQTSWNDATTFGTVKVIEVAVWAVMAAGLGSLWSELKIPTLSM